MKQGYRFVDCDMHIMEPPDLFERYLDPAFKHRISSSMRRSDGGPTGMRGRPLWFFDGTPTSNDVADAFEGVMFVGNGKLTVKPLGLVGHQGLGFTWNN